MAVHDTHTIAGSRDAKSTLFFKRGTVGGHRAENLAGLGLKLVLLTRDEGHNVVHDVHGGDTRVAGAGNGLHRDDGSEVDGTKGGLEGGERDGDADDGAVRVADKKTLISRAKLALVGDEVEMVEVDSRDDERDGRILAVVLGVGEDGETSVLELGFWRRRAGLESSL